MENYSESIQNYRDQLVEQISDAAYSEALAVKDKVVEQFNCVADVSFTEISLIALPL